jgi:phage terminase large subunit-like protein
MYLSHHMLNDLGDCRLMCKTAPMHHDMCMAYRRSNRSILVAPAKFAKSTWSCFFQPLADGVLGLVDGDILLISNTGRLAEHWLSLIKEEIEHNKDLIRVYGQLKGGIWRQDHIRLKTGINIVSLGLSYQIRGTGWAKVVADDMEDDDMVRSEEQREKFSDWWDGAMMGRMHPHTKVIIDGTLLHPLCKLKKMYENFDGQYDSWVRMKFAALDDKGESTWPDRWPTHVIEQQRREMGNKAFMAEKMNEPIFGEDHIINPEWIKRYSQRPQHMDMIITCFDSSSGVSKEVGDYAGHITWGLVFSEQDPPGDIYLMASRRGRWPLYEKTKVLMDYDKLYDPLYNLIESDAYGKELREAIAKEADREGRCFPKRLIDVDKNKARRLMATTDLFQRGKVWFPERGAEKVIDQLLMFSPTHELDNDEFVDCTSMGLRFLKRQRPRRRREKHIDRPFNRAKPNKAGRLV